MKSVEILNERLDLTRYEDQAFKAIYREFHRFWTDEKRQKLLADDPDAKVEIYELIAGLQAKLGRIAGLFADRNDILFLSVTVRFYPYPPSPQATMGATSSKMDTNSAFLRYYITLNFDYTNKDIELKCYTKYFCTSFV